MLLRSSILAVLLSLTAVLSTMAEDRRSVPGYSSVTPNVFGGRSQDFPADVSKYSVTEPKSVPKGHRVIAIWDGNEQFFAIVPEGFRGGALPANPPTEKSSLLWIFVNVFAIVLLGILVYRKRRNTSKPAAA